MLVCIQKIGLDVATVHHHIPDPRQAGYFTHCSGTRPVGSTYVQLQRCRQRAPKKPGNDSEHEACMHTEHAPATTAPGRVVWSTDTGFRCVIRAYDDTRYQLRLAWRDGTVKSDLFDSYDEALAVASTWRSEVDARERLHP